MRKDAKGEKTGRGGREARGGKERTESPAPADRATQIRARLDEEAKQQARLQGRFMDMQRLLIRYASERFLYRLGQSPLENAFILKGALVLAIYTPDELRSTRDADFLVFGHYTREEMKEALTAICAKVSDDGLVFDPTGITVEEAGADRGYTGYTVKIPVRLGASPCNLSLDLAFGEAVTPPNAPRVEYPSLLDLPKPLVRVYPLPTVIAEKFQIIVDLSISNGRLKDYYDLYQIAQRCEIEGPVLRDAILATFGRRKTAIPTETPRGLGPDYYDSKRWKTEWPNWLRSLALPKSANLEAYCQVIADLLMPVARAAAADEAFSMVWREGAWHEQ